jgi:hypothetical protein
VFDYIKNLDFYEDPDYNYIMSELSFILEESGSAGDLTYDWEALTSDLRL